MSQIEQKPHAKPRRSKLAKAPETEPQASEGSNFDDENYRKQREANDYGNHEDYPRGAKDANAPAKHSDEGAKDELPDRRRREPNLKP